MEHGRKNITARRVARFFIATFMVPFCVLNAFSQNLEELGVKQGVKVNGSLNLNTIGYWANGIDQRRDPFNWFLSGNVNINLFGYNAPFSFSYSNANRNFSQPFNQFSFQPQYKWIRTYIGYNAMTFSNYTLSGHMFMGAGAELNPGKWRVSMMYGRLRKAVPFNITDSVQYTDASFKRMGYGLKVGYENNGDNISANIFTAKDELFSIPFVLPESQLSPQQNVAMSISGRKKIFERLYIEAEYAVSALNKDMRLTGEESPDTVVAATHNLVKNLLPENATNRYFDALNASLGYTGNWYMIAIRYERVAPEYQTLGAYYFNNDMENITLAPAFKFFNGQLNLAMNVGLQQNNLDNTRTSSTERWVGNVNASYVPGAKWNFAANYSNFTSFTNIRPQEDPFFRDNLDTLNFYQVNQTTSGTVIRNLGGKNNPQSIMVNLSYQQANDEATYEGGTQTSDFRSINASYTYSLVPSNTTVGLAANVYQNNAVGFSSTYWGPSLSLTKSFLEKTLKGSLASAYNETTANGVKASPVWSNRLALNFIPKSDKGEDSTSNHTLSLGINVLRRFRGTERQPAFTEYTATANYTYTF